MLPHCRHGPGAQQGTGERWQVPGSGESGREVFLGGTKVKQEKGMAQDGGGPGRGLYRWILCPAWGFKIVGTETQRVPLKGMGFYSGKETNVSFPQETSGHCPGPIEYSSGHFCTAVALGTGAARLVCPLCPCWRMVLLSLGRSSSPPCSILYCLFTVFLLSPEGRDLEEHPISFSFHIFQL